MLNGTLTFDRCDENAVTLGHGIKNDLGLIKRDQDDTLLWGKRVADGWRDINAQFATDPGIGTIFVAGRFEGAAVFTLSDGQTTTMGEVGQRNALRPSRHSTPL